MHAYRTHTCGQLRAGDKGKTVRISGWIHRVRDHGGVLFVDLRDHYGLTQVVVKQNNPIAKEIEKLKLENVICITGDVLMRTPETVNKQLPTGEIELEAKSMDLLSSEVTEMLPLQVNSDEPYGEDVRLKYRFLDLRRNVIHRNIMLRSDVVYSMRRRMVEQGFREFTTPILTASSPEGARDFLVPSRLHPGKFYALPQAPQQFKQLLMMSGFDRYFQIAPCFRDEDARADRTAGEFYQLDMEMSFVTQDDVFSVMEKVIGGVFEEFSEFTGTKQAVTPAPWIRIPYDESMLKYGNDKPDLRCPIVMFDASEMWAKSDFGVFKGIVEKGGQVRAIPAKNAGKMPRSWFDKLGSWAQSELGMPAPPGYIVLKEIKDGKNVYAGPLAKFVESQLEDLFKKAFPKPEVGDTVFFVGNPDVAKLNSQVAPLRVRIGNELELSEKDCFKFCWVVDYPMFEINDKTNKVDFSHNPFSMPQGGLKALQTQDPLKIKATQYDCVANGLELCSGGIRNHNPDAMEKAFEIAGYPKGAVQEKFGGMYNAFKLGAPPHGGCAFGIDRIIMMLAKEPNIREVIAFPMNQQAEDLMMGAPSSAEPHQLRDVHIKLELPKPQERKAS